MRNSIYPSGQTQNISAVCLQHSVRRAVIPLVDTNNRLNNSQYINSPIVATSGSNVLVSGVQNHRVQVQSYTLNSVSSCTAKFVNGSTDLTGTMTLGSNSTLTSVSESDLFECSDGSNLVLTTNGSINGYISYRIV